MEEKLKVLDDCVRRELLEEWPVWRVVIARKATLTEIETNYTLDDLLRLNACLDMKDAGEILAGEET